MMALTSERNFDQDCASLHRSDIIILFIFLSFKRPRLPHVTVGFWLKWGGTLALTHTPVTHTGHLPVRHFLWGPPSKVPPSPYLYFLRTTFSSLIDFHGYEPHREEIPILALKLWSLSNKRTHLSSNCVTESQWISLFTSPWVLLGNWDVPDGSVA